MRTSHIPLVIYSVEPQRSNGRGFDLCLDYQAERFAVVEIKYLKTRNGRRFAKRRIITCFPSRSLAEHEARAMTRRSDHRSGHHPKLGARFPKTERKIIARSCTLDEYEQIMKGDDQ